MNILITGAAGFLGSHLVEHFLKEGHNVVGIDNLSGGSLDNLSFCYSKNCRTEKNFTFIQLDCRDLYNMKRMNLFKDIDVVYHCACLPHEGLSVFSPSLITKSVFEASVSVFSAAISAGVKRIIYMSSMSRYGHGSERFVEDVDGYNNGIYTTYKAEFIKSPFTEDLKPFPTDPYAIAKVASEETLKCLCETHGVEYIIAVPHNIIGVRQNYTDPHRNVASIMMNRIKQDKDVVIYGDGEQTRCFSPIADCLDCLVKMANLDDKRIVGEVINIGPDKGSITINQLAETIYNIAGELPRATHYPDRPREVKHASCSSDKARELLGYSEKQPLVCCLKEMWEAIPQGGKPFIYEGKPLEIINEKTPETWKNKLI